MPIKEVDEWLLMMDGVEFELSRCKGTTGAVFVINVLQEDDSRTTEPDYRFCTRRKSVQPMYKR